MSQKGFHISCVNHRQPQEVIKRTEMDRVKSRLYCTSLQKRNCMFDSGASEWHKFCKNICQLALASEIWIQGRKITAVRGDLNGFGSLVSHIWTGTFWQWRHKGSNSWAVGGNHYQHKELQSVQDGPYKVSGSCIHRLLLYLCVTIKNGYRQRKVI